MPARKALSKRTRFEVFKRDDFQCRYCGARAPSVLLHIDHIVPVADGGSNALENLISACDGCNLGKGAKGLGEKSPPVALDAANDLAEKTEQLLAYRKAMSEWVAAQAEFEQEVAIAVYNALWGHEDPGKMLPNTDARAAIRFIEKLGFKRVLDLAAYTGSRARKFYNYHQAWKYFYACCRNVVQEEVGDE